MSQNWVSNLDMCANYGIIDYDAASFLRNKPPRYMGSPQFKVAPENDHFYGKAPYQQPTTENPRNGKIENGRKRKNPVWKIILFGLVIKGALVFAGYKLRNKKFMQPVVNFTKKAWNFVKKPFVKTPVTP